MEIPSSHAGVVKELKVKIGDKVAKGTLIAVLQASGGGRRRAGCAAPRRRSRAATADCGAAPAPRVAAAPAAVPRTSRRAPSAALPHASPSIRRFARELGVPLAQVKGSGPKGRITQEDVQGFVKAVDRPGRGAEGRRAPRRRPAAASPGLLPWPQVDFAKFGPVERKDLCRIKKISGANLHRNWVLIPHVTNHDEADITELEAFRVQLNKENEKSGVKVTMLAFVIKAVVAALKKFPDFNASLDGDAAGLQAVLPHRLRGRHAERPGGAGDQGRRQEGHAADRHEMGELSKKARDGKLGPADMSGGCFTICSAGRHRRHATSRRSSTRRRSRSWACPRATRSRSGTARPSCRG